MGLLPKLKGDEQEVVTAEKEGKTRTVRMTVFPPEGGRPYVADVEVDEQGTFDLGDEQETTYHVTRGSLWQEGTHVRGLVNEGNPQTISPETLTGDDAMDPTVLHGMVRNNMWTQLDEISRRKNPWKQGTTWAMIAMGMGLLLMVFWQIRTMGDGFEQLAQAIRSLSLGGRGGSGHQDISPEGTLAVLAFPARWLRAREWW